MGWYYFLLLIVSSVQDVGLFAGGYKVSEVAGRSSHRSQLLPSSINTSKLHDHDSTNFVYLCWVGNLCICTEYRNSVGLSQS